MYEKYSLNKNRKRLSDSYKSIKEPYHCFSHLIWLFYWKEKGVTDFFILFTKKGKQTFFLEHGTILFYLRCSSLKYSNVYL